MTNDKFLGHNGFLWFTGVVEDRNDPNKAGRVRVRALGHHTSNNILLPTADLPWAHCMLASTSAGISGLGHSATGLVEGSWVLGYFRDGNERQEMIVLGTLPGVPAECHRRVASMIQTLSIQSTKMSQIPTGSQWLMKT